jgi:hypothetical protein
MIATDTPRQLGTASTYAELMHILRERAEELDVSRATIGAVAGLTSGHCEKLMAPQPSKNLGVVTLPLLLGALGLRLTVTEDLAALARVKSRLVPREVKIPEHAYSWGRQGARLVSKRWVRKIAAAGGNARSRALTPARRRAIARQAARARWSAPRVVAVVTKRPIG